MAWFLCALNVFLHVQNLWCTEPMISPPEVFVWRQPFSYMNIFRRKKYLTFHIILYHLFYQQSQFKIIFFLYLGPKLFRFWLQPVVENHNHFEKMMMLSFLAYEIRTDDRVYVKFIFKYISEFFTAILIN